MKLDSIKDHWESWAREFGTGLRATTKAPSLKKLEIDALQRGIRSVGLANRDHAKILEVGCGNGYNCFALANIFAQFNVTGVDLVPQMISAAQALKEASNLPNVEFRVGDIRELDRNAELADGYDLILTDRCIINLNNDELQQAALDQLSKKLVPGGFLLLIENPQALHSAQNDLREWVGLPRRPIAEFNHFLSEDQFLAHANRSLDLIKVEDFISLHDIVLYVLLPMINGGKTDYEHPIVHAAAELSVRMNEHYTSPCGSFGQNRMYIFSKRRSHPAGAEDTAESNV